jgi:hypothetical protein
MAAAGAIRCRHSTDGGVQWPSNEAPDVLHWVMRPAFYHHICMTIDIASNSLAFFIVVDTFFAPNLI